MLHQLISSALYLYALLMLSSIAVWSTDSSGFCISSLRLHPPVLQPSDLTAVPDSGPSCLCKQWTVSSVSAVPGPTATHLAPLTRLCSSGHREIYCELLQAGLLGGLVVKVVLSGYFVPRLPPQCALVSGSLSLSSSSRVESKLNGNLPNTNASLRSNETRRDDHSL